MFPVQPAETSSLLPNASSDDEETNLPREDEQHTTEGESNEDNNVDTGGAIPGPVAQLAQRLRCLFATITWPIVPLATILSFALLWVLYAAFVLDVRRSCSRPLHWYAVISLLFVSYAPHHPQVRNYLFEYSPERDGPPRPLAVRMYDQLFHTLCILYVYGGVTLLETCQEDIGKTTTTSNVVYVKPEDQPSSSEAPSNTCAATCPNLYQAISIYVTTLELFTFALILPLLFLPCVYLWIIRRASAEAEAFSQFQDILEEEEALLTNGGITAQEIIDSLEKVKLVSINETDVVLLPLSSSNDDAREGNTTRECCICMTEFAITEPSDIETGPTAAADIIVRTKCKHLFHGACLAGWLGGRWEPNESNQTSNDTSRRRARRTACPLCREDLKPARE